jgi:branched-chain amino acid aminotransferase
LFNADECFLTGTGAELIPVREISGRRIRHSPGTVYQLIEKAFRRELQGEAFFS